MTDAATAFESHRSYLVGLAYRMLGSVAEAEDVVQDAFLRWQARAAEDITAPRAFLSRVVTRLCLDRLKSARAQREHYVGTWLPEPVVEPAAPRADEAMALADDLSVALLVTLERLSPLERAAFLLHDVFEMGRAALNPIYGRDKILRFFIGIAAKRAEAPPSAIDRVMINGLPGFVLHGPEGIETLALEISGDHIVAVYAIRNPDKLRHLA